MKMDHLKGIMESPHPAAIWAAEATLDPLQVDCVTAEMLKILDHKCKMPPEEQIAVMAVYSVVKERKGLLLDSTFHDAIEHAPRAMWKPASHYWMQLTGKLWKKPAMARKNYGI